MREGVVDGGWWMTNALGQYRAEGGISMRQDGSEGPDSAVGSGDMPMGGTQSGVPWPLCSVANAI